MNSHMRRKLSAMRLAPAAVFLFFALAPPAALERITTIKNYSHDSSARDRLSSWTVAKRIARERPMTGVGPGNFLAVYDRYRNDFRSPHVAHNTPLQILANAGIPALASFSVLLLYGVFAAARLASRARVKRRLARSPEDRRTFEWVDALGTSISLSMLAFAVGSQFLSREDMDLFYLLTGLVAAMAVQMRATLARGTAPRPAGATCVSVR